MRPQISDARDTYLQCLLQGKRQGACSLALSMLRHGYSLADIYVEVLQESMIQIGHLWETHCISVAEEHRATVITQFVMAQLYPTIQLPTTPKSTIVITGVEGEMHQLGANMVADVLEDDGHLVQFLGTNLPDSSIVKLVAKQSPDLLGISATMLFSLPKVAQLVDSIRKLMGPQSPIILLGGAALRQAPHFADEVGCLGCTSDLRGALTLVGRATSGPVG